MPIPGSLEPLSEPGVLEERRRTAIVAAQPWSLRGA